MNKHKQIENEILKQILPNDDDRRTLESIIEDVTLKVNKEIKNRNLLASTTLVGSTAKDTFLRNNLDVDLFIMFPAGTEKGFMADHVLSMGRTLLRKTEECYAEHPYIRGMYQGFKVELVPCYRIQNASQKLSAVDRTPLHTNYVMQHITDEQKQEVRLFKQFLHGIGCYGAEASIQGFSGYLCEILIIQFDTFHDLLTKAVDWKPGTKLSLLDKKIPDFPETLIVIDPVDPERNVASAISPETFSLFKKASSAYLKDPKTTFFFPNPIKPWSLDKIRTLIQTGPYKYIGIRFPKPDIIDENLYPQIRKAGKNIETVCTASGFTIHNTLPMVDEKNKQIYLIIQSDKEPISEKQTHMGPPTDLEPHQEKFLEKWENNPQVIQGPYKKNKRWYVDIKREYTDLEPFITIILPSLSLGKHLESIIKQQFTLMRADELLTEELLPFWTQHLDGKETWER